MSNIKRLGLGSAAALIAVGGAEAADLPVKAKAVEYVRVCSLYGAGFYYIPGTDTCLRIGGYVFAEVTVNGAPSDATNLNGDGGLGLRTANSYQSRARIAVNVDTRTQTDWGVVRTFAAFEPQFTQGADTQGNGGIRVESAFVQFAGFTFGRSNSAYALPWNGIPGNINTALRGGPSYDAGVNNVQYTWQFGNGVSASVGVDSQEQENRTTILNTAAGVTVLGTNVTAGPITTPGGNGYYAGSNIPDIVGSVKVDQAWGLVQFSGAAHQVNATYYGATGTAESLGHPGDKWGFAVTGALQLKNLPTGPGDDIKFSATYTEGALHYVLGQGGATVPGNFAVLNNGTTFAGVPIADGVYGATGSMQLTKAFGFNGAFNHNWNPHWSSSVFGSWTKLDYNDTATATICATGYGARVIAGVCNPDFNISQLGLMTTWRPVKNLAIIAEGTWVHIDQKNTGTTTLPAPNTRVVAFGDTDSYSGIMRVQRNF